jgi:hypothetical protein
MKLSSRSTPTSLWGRLAGDLDHSSSTIRDKIIIQLKKLDPFPVIDLVSLVAPIERRRTSGVEWRTDHDSRGEIQIGDSMGANRGHVDEVIGKIRSARLSRLRRGSSELVKVDIAQPQQVSFWVSHFSNTCDKTDAAKQVTY